MAESYLRTQEDLAEKITKGKANFKKAPKERLTLSYIETRLETLEAQWNLFINTHRKIVFEMRREEFLCTQYSTAHIYDLTEEEYINYKSSLKGFLVKFKSNNEEVPRGSETKACFVKLPEIVLPKFSGKYSEWVGFKDLFNSLIHNNGSLDDVQRLQYLKSSLTGEAETIVKTIAVTATNYKICWDRLVARYDNKRSMANSIIRRLMNQKPVGQESATAIRQLLDTTSECLQSLGNVGVDVSSWDLILIYVISQKLDTESRAKWEAKMSESSEELPKYKQLESFLETRFRSLEYKMSDKSHPIATNTTKSSHTTTAVVYTCPFCSEKHKLHNCKRFVKEDVEAKRQFVQTQHLCFNCFSPEHSVYMCKVSTNCRLCKKRHHTLLHPKTPHPPVGNSDYEKKKVVAVVTGTTSPSMESEVHEETPEIVTSCFSTSRNTVLLATALVSARAQTDSSSASVLRSLLDQGSQASFVTESAAQLLGLKKIKESVTISGVGESKSLESKASVHIRLTSRSDPSFSLNVKAHVLEKLTTLLPGNKVSIDSSQMNALPSLVLADPSFHRPGGIDLLLGAEVYSKIIIDGLIQSVGGGFIAQKTRFGWILSGVVQDSNLNGHNVNCHTITINESNDDILLKRFWELESEPSLPDKILTKEEMACEELFAATTTRDEAGRYIVKLPFREENPASKYGESQIIARKRFFMLEKRLLCNPTLKAEYSKVINEYMAMGHMELCSDNDKDTVYLPHHAVVREDKDTTKVRVVFDASCKGINGASLNSDLMTGPTLQPELRHLVMRWRCYPISLVADIVKMYRQVKVADEDADYQRIVWREDPKDPLKHFRLLRVTFGTSSAPYLAVRALQQVAHEEGSDFPEAVHRVLSDFYVDDLMTGCHSVAEGIEVHKQMTELLSRAGFPLQKWSSNNKELCKNVCHNNSHQSLEIRTDDVMKILGLAWNKETDEFRIKVNLALLSDSPVTKRMVISDIAKLFDPLGWLAPSITKAKIFIQKLWLSGIGWDSQLPPDLLNDWLSFRQNLTHLESFSIPRWMHCTTDDQLFELHGFSDASNLAYAAVVYARVIDKDNNVFVHLVTSKTRVAPIKQVSIPRLELCGASLLAKLLNEVSHILNVPKQNIHAWSDSTIVLAWLSSHPSRWKTFVANRVSDILTVMDGNQWSHVSSDENPADCASRGLQPTECVHNQLWKYGPKWLHNYSIEYSKQNAKDTHVEERKAKTTCHVAAKDEPNDGEELLSRYSSLLKLTRVVSFCRRLLRWKNPEKEKSDRLDNSLSIREINEALLTCIKLCQRTHFKQEINSLQSSEPISKKSKLASLNPYLDAQEIMRVGGRLNNAVLEENMKHPIIIPHNSNFTLLLIDEAHRRTMHGGSQMMLNYLRSKYWLIGAKSLINLRLILVSGKTKEFPFNPVDSAGDIAMHVYDNWPEADWATESVSRAEILRLIYQGRFLHSSVTLGALGLPLGRTTVMHLVPREHLPEPNSHDQRQKSKGGSSSCCSASCCIL